MDRWIAKTVNFWIPTIQQSITPEMVLQCSSLHLLLVIRELTAVD
jgi:hypothetical protein